VIGSKVMSGQDRIPLGIEGELARGIKFGIGEVALGEVTT
jgi:hypothetical protein